MFFLLKKKRGEGNQPEPHSFHILTPFLLGFPEQPDNSHQVQAKVGSPAERFFSGNPQAKTLATGQGKGEAAGVGLVGRACVANTKW